MAVSPLIRNALDRVCDVYRTKVSAEVHAKMCMYRRVPSGKSLLTLEVKWSYIDISTTVRFFDSRGLSAISIGCIPPGSTGVPDGLRNNFNFSMSFPIIT